MRHQLHLQTLQDRRRDIRLTLFFKIVQGLTPAIEIKNHLEPINYNRRQIRAKKYDNCVSNNPIEKYHQNHNKCFKIPHSTKVELENSFFFRTAIDWNNLKQETVDAASINAFRANLRRK